MKGPDEPEPLKSSISTSKDKGKKKATTTIETLNAPAPAESSDPNVEEQPDDEESDSEEEIEGLPDLTPELLGFSKIEIGNYEKSYLYIQQHRSVYVPGAYDALLVAAYHAESKGQHKYAKQCVNQALLLQYCEKLGKDGPALFFRRYYDYYYSPIGKVLMNVIIGRSPGMPRLSRYSRRMWRIPTTFSAHVSKPARMI